MGKLDGKIALGRGRHHDAGATPSRPAMLRREAIGRRFAPQDSYVPMSVEGATSLATLSDEDVISALRNVVDRKLGDDLFAELFRRYGNQVRSWCLRFTSDRNHAFDLTQEIFFKVYRYTHSYRGDSMFSTWLYSITRNHCCNSRKKKAAEPVECASLISHLQPDSKAHDPYSAAETKQSARRIWNLIFSALNPLEARVISMHYIREIPLSAITQQLALSNPSGAKAYIVSARRKLNGAFRHKKSEQA
jgi:RNA polymerase sigma-70 factor (ECF subfamily)